MFVLQQGNHTMRVCVANQRLTGFQTADTADKNKSSMDALLSTMELGEKCKRSLEIITKTAELVKNEALGMVGFHLWQLNIFGPICLLALFCFHFLNL